MNTSFVSVIIPQDAAPDSYVDVKVRVRLDLGRGMVFVYMVAGAEYIPLGADIFLETGGWIDLSGFFKMPAVDTRVFIYTNFADYADPGYPNYIPDNSVDYMVKVPIAGLNTFDSLTAVYR